MTLKDAIIQHFITQAIMDWVKRTRKDKGAMNFLNGYKTYIIAGLTIVLLILHWFGVDLPFVDYNHLPAIGAALAAITARMGGKDDAARAVVVSTNPPSSLPVNASVSQAKTAIQHVDTGL